MIFVQAFIACICILEPRPYRTVEQSDKTWEPCCFFPVEFKFSFLFFIFASLKSPIVYCIDDKLCLWIDPEYVIERRSKGRATSCGCLSDMELPEPECTKTTVTVTACESTIEVNKTDRQDRQLVSENVLERCGECNLHNCKYWIVLKATRQCFMFHMTHTVYGQGHAWYLNTLGKDLKRSAYILVSK
jgi:hypothetical protein